MSNKTRIVINNCDCKAAVFLSHIHDVIERAGTKALAGNDLLQKSTRVGNRAPHLSTIERELRGLKKVVEALAVRSVAQELQLHFFTTDGMTVLDTDRAYQLLDDPPEPSEELLKLLSLR